MCARSTGWSEREAPSEVTMRERALQAWCLCLVVLTGACAQASPAITPQAGSALQPDVPRPPKVLTIGIQREPPDFGFGSFTGSRNAGGAGNAEFLPHDALAVERETGAVQAELAVDVPSVDRGSLRINSDGSMDTMWQLRPNVRWHDGAPFTSDDLMFSFTVFKDPTLPSSNIVVRPFLLAASAPDPLTFVMHWSGPYYRGISTQPGTIKPR